MEPLSAKRRTRRTVLAVKEEELEQNLALRTREHYLPFDKTTIYARPNKRREVDVFTAPIQIGPLCRLTRIVVAARVAGDVLIKELAVEGRPNVLAVEIVPNE